MTLRYLKTYPNLGLKYSTSLHESFLEPFQITAFCDSSHGAGVDLKPILGSVIFLNNNVFKYKTKKWKSISNSSCESEFIAIYFVTKELINLMNALIGLGITFKPPLVFNDNQAAIALVKSRKEIDKAKSIKIHILWCRQEYRKGNIKLEYIPSSQNLADPFTKSLAASKFHFFRSYLCSEILVPAEESCLPLHGKEGE